VVLLETVGLELVEGAVEGEAVVDVLLQEVVAEVDALVLLAVAVLLDHVQQLHEHVGLRAV
jgi:hypothetical protein